MLRTTAPNCDVDCNYDVECYFVLMMIGVAKDVDWPGGFVKPVVNSFLYMRNIPYLSIITPTTLIATFTTTPTVTRVVVATTKKPNVNP